MPRKARTSVNRNHPYPPHTSPLEVLPFELKLRVVSHLSKSDAKNLAVVSQSLQDAAESIIWTRVDMSLPANWDKQYLIWEESMPNWWELDEFTPDIEEILVGLKSTMDMEGGSMDSLSSDEDICWSIRSLKYTTRLKQVSMALQSRPSRIGWVNQLYLELTPTDNDICDRVREVIHLIRENLRIVRIGAPEINLRDRYGWFKDQLHTSTLIKSIGLITPNIPKLHSLEIVLSKTPYLDVQLSEILESIGPIRNLILNPSWPISATISDDRSKLLPKLPSLKSLRLNYLHPHSMQAICRLVKSAEDLEELKVEFIDEKKAWQVYGKDLTEVEIKSLSEHKCLKKIEWFGGLEAKWWFEKISEKGFDNVEMLVQSQAVECESETFMENILIPPFPSLRSILIPCRTPKWYRHLSPPDWAKAPPPRNSISPHVISHLRSAPNLLAVQFGCLSSLTVEEVIDSSTWCDKRFNGVLVRSYNNQATGEEFHHLRRLELLTVQPRIYDFTYHEKYEKMKECQGNEVDHRWVDHTSYKNATLPPPILKKIYKSLGQKGDWQIPGRGLELPESTWEILRSWRVKLPDKGVEGRKIVTRRMARDLQ